MPAHSAIGTIALGLGFTLFLGCSGSDEQANAEEVFGRSPAEIARESDSRDPCSLITESEVESIVGNTVTITSDAERSSCLYNADAPTGRGFSVKVYWTDGKENLEATKSAMNIAPQLMEDNGMETMGLMTLQPVGEIGDEAYYNPIVGSYVLKGNTLLEFDLRLLLGGNPSKPDAIQQWRALTAKALSRI
jgi:hypothetical protein